MWPDNQRSPSVITNAKLRAMRRREKQQWLASLRKKAR